MELFTERLKLRDVMPEVAKDIAKEYKLKEDDLELVRKNNPLRSEDIKIEDGERAAVRYVNTADVDRDNEIVVPDGLQVKDFLKSPSVLYAHNYRGLPIGKDTWLKLIKGKGWLAKTIYAKHELATDVYNLVKDKFLNTNPMASPSSSIPFSNSSISTSSTLPSFTSFKPCSSFFLPSSDNSTSSFSFSLLIILTFTSSAISLMSSDDFSFPSSTI